MSTGERFVFLDRTGKRWPRVRLLMFLWGVALFLGIVAFARSLLTPPPLLLPKPVRELKSKIQGVQVSTNAPWCSSTNQMWLRFARTGSATARHVAKLRESAGVTNAAPAEIRLGYVVGWDQRSLVSLRKNAGSLTHVCPEWFTMTDATGEITSEPDEGAREVAKSHGLALMPLLANLSETGWISEPVETMAGADETRQAAWVGKLTTELKETGAAGVIVDWEQWDPVRRNQVTALLTRMAASLHEEDMELWLTVPMGEEQAGYDLDALAEVVDRFVAMLRDETSDSDAPGPVASQAWVEGWVKTMSGYGEPSQWIAAVGAYGYDWTEGKPEAETIAFVDAMSRAGDSDVTNCVIADPLFQPSFEFTDEGKRHTVWFQDAVTFLNQIDAARDAGFGGVGISFLGMEDPEIWRALAMDTRGNAPMGATDRVMLERLTPGDTIAHVGEGEFVTPDEEDIATGRRELLPQPDGRVGARYESFPRYPTLLHTGNGGPKRVAITFDDGPDAEWTPRILDILKRANVKAGFFLVGSAAEDHPALVKRIVSEGHDLGNHTYTHPNLLLASDELVRLELNATQRLFESLTGRSSTLFRPPYNADAYPTDPDEMRPLRVAQKLGYVTVCENIDPQDWSRPGAREILRRVKAGRARGNIILLHDAGGDRSQTVAALPWIIEWLHERGDEIVPPHELLEQTLDEVMPRVADTRSLTARVASLGFRVWHAISSVFLAFLIVTTVLVAVRTAIVVWLSLRFRSRPAPKPLEPSPGVSVLIAAFNESKVIGATLLSVLSTKYAGLLEVVVVDDGSRDNTAEVVRGIALTEPRVRLIAKSNQGKAEALKRAVQEAKHDLVVMLDADTQFTRDTISELIAPFSDERMGAVSGYAKVGNEHTFIAKCQALEYICGFNLDRAAMSEWNCVTVVPGAVSAFRRRAIAEAGGLSTDTLAEDTDLTLALHRAGWHIGFAPGALALTEAPETLRGLAKQRFRWCYGTMQCLWKHRDLVFNPKFRALAWFSLPGIWFFQILLVAVVPVIDLLLVLSFLGGLWTAILPYVLGFLAMDVLVALVACAMQREPMRRAWYIVPMRFVYRPLLAWVVWKSIFRALAGARVGWGKLDRTGSVWGRHETVSMVRAASRLLSGGM